MLLLLVLLCLSGGTNAQFAEIASLATSLIGPALSGAGIAGTAGQAAGGAVGALGQIGQLYQLAQGALQLTGTGVGVLNQATEGNWFPAALEAAAKNQESIRKNGGGLGGGGLEGGGLGGGLGGLGGLMPLGPLGPAGGKTGGSAGVGPEFGTSFPAPDIDDYNEEIDLTSTTTTTAKPKSPFGSEEIEDKDLQSKTTTTAKTTTEASTVPVTLFPDEEEETSPTTLTPKKQIRIELPKEEEDYIDQVTKEGATEVEVTNREKQTEEDTLEPSPAPVVLSPKKTERGTEGVPNLEKLVTALKQKSSLTEEEIREIVGQVETNFNHDKPPKIDFGSGVQNINEKKASNRKRIIEASRRIDASNYHGQSHRKLSSVTLPPTTAPTPAPFVHSSTPTPDEILNNRLQREILAVGAGDKDLLSSRPVVQQKPFVPPTTVATSPPVVTFVYPPHPQVQPQPQPQLQPVQPQPHLQPQLPTQPQPQQYYYQHPTSFPIQQQTQQPHVQQPYYQQYQQQYYPQYYQQYQQQQYGQQYQQQYGQQQRQQAVVQPQQQVIQPQYHTQQQIVMSGTAQANRPVVQHQQQIQQVQQVHKVQGTRQMREGDVRPQRHVHTVSGQSTRIYTNQPAGAAFFVASNGSPVIRRQSPSPVRAQAARTIRRATPSPSQRRPFARTARTQPLTTPSPVRRVPARSNPANQH